MLSSWPLAAAAAVRPIDLRGICRLSAAAAQQGKRFFAPPCVCHRPQPPPWIARSGRAFSPSSLGSSSLGGSSLRGNLINLYDPWARTPKFLDSWDSIFCTCLMDRSMLVFFSDAATMHRCQSKITEVEEEASGYGAGYGSGRPVPSFIIRSPSVHVTWQ
jgi:hypothetical protein